MTIYYQLNNKTHADRYDNLSPISGLSIENPNKISISTVSNPDADALQSSLDFGRDAYIEHNITYRPIFKLYNNFYQ